MKVVLIVGSECNTKCKHCYIVDATRRSPKNAVETVMALKGQGHEVVIAGGEVLMEPEYLKAYQRAGQKHLLTNGILLKTNPELYDLMRDHGIEQLTFSIHFDIDARLRSVPERFVAERVREARQRGFRVQVTTLITPENVDGIAAMCERSVSYGVNILQFNRFVQMGRGEESQEHALSEEQIERFFSQVEEQRKRFSKDVLVIKPNGNFGPRPGSKGESLAYENKYCPAGIDLVGIDPDGKVYGCPFTMNDDAVIGRFVDGKIIIEKEFSDGRRDTCMAHLLHEKSR